MNIDILTFGMTKQIIGSTVFTMDVPDGCTVKELKSILEEKFPEFKTLNSLHIAVNSDYATSDQILNSRDEIALIPPVSGG